MAKKRSNTAEAGVAPGDQQILDEICDAVAGQGGYGMTDWTIGKTDDVVGYVATRLGRKPYAVSRGLNRLIDRGLFATDCHEPWDPDEDAPLLGWISIEKGGWQRWSLWDPTDERMIEIGRDQFQNDPIWVVADHAQLTAAADRFRRGYRGRGTPPAECLAEGLAEHYHPPANTTRDAVGVRQTGTRVIVYYRWARTGQEQHEQEVAEYLSERTLNVVGSHRETNAATRPVLEEVIAAARRHGAVILIGGRYSKDRTFEIICSRLHQEGIAGYWVGSMWGGFLQ